MLDYCFARFTKSGKENWNAPSDPTLYIEAFTTSHYTLGFRLRKKKPRMKIKRDPTFETPAENVNLVTSANRSGAVSVQNTGLNLALVLGLIRLDQFEHLSIEFGKCSASVWMEYDNEFVARYITICSSNKDDATIHQFEIKTNNFSSWEKAFDLLFKIKESMALKKQKLVQILLYKLQSTSSQTLNSPYKKCAKQLEVAIRQLKVVLFSVDDTCIHAIKLKFATYLKMNDFANQGYWNFTSITSC